MKKTPAVESIKIGVPDHVPLSQHVGQVLVVGTYPHQKKVEVVFVNKANRTLHCKLLTKN